MCGLDADEVAAIAEHEHLPDIAAPALAAYLLKQAGGAERIRQMILRIFTKRSTRATFATERSYSSRYAIFSSTSRVP
jgi:hypothetical protein